MRTPPAKKLKPPLDLVTVSKEWGVHKPNGRTECALILITTLQPCKHAGVCLFGF